MEIKKFLAAGKWCSSRRSFEIKNPFNGEIVDHVHKPSADDVERAIAAADKAFDSWRKAPLYERSAILMKAAGLVAERRETLAKTIALEAGKPIKTARGEVDRTAGLFVDAVAAVRGFSGELLPVDINPTAEGRKGIVKRFPIGPLSAITPFNFPLMLVAHKFAPAVGAGCTLVHKPASATPLSSLLLAEIMIEAGTPAEVISVLPLSGDDAAALVDDPRLKGLTFTGSAAVGWGLKARVFRKRVSLELGGNAAAVVHEDADVDYAAERCVAGGYAYAGQSCISTQRIIVHEKVYDDFLAAFIPQVEALKAGDPLDEETDVGPVITPGDADRISRWILEAKNSGANLVCGGEREGSVIRPAVLEKVAHSANVWKKEAFAPLTVIEKYGEFEDALRMVNDSDFGLQAGVFTRDVERIWQAYEELEVGGVIAGDMPTFRADNQPYGGVKDSGFGREGVRWAMEEMTEPKALIINIRR